MMKSQPKTVLVTKKFRHVLHWNAVVDCRRQRTRDAQRLDRYNQITTYLLAGLSIGDTMLVVLAV